MAEESRRKLQLRAHLVQTQSQPPQRTARSSVQRPFQVPCGAPPSRACKPRQQRLSTRRRQAPPLYTAATTPRFRPPRLAS